MKKISILILTVLFAGTSLFAQSSKDARMQKAKLSAEKLAVQLDMTEDQINKKAEIDTEMYGKFEEIQAKRKAIMDKRQNMGEDASNEDREALGKEMEALRNEQMEIRKAADEQFLEILTDEQKAAYKKMKTPTSSKKPPMEKGK